MLPVPPAKVTTKIRSMNKTVNLINEGEINILKDPGLTEISFDMRIPSSSRPYTSYSEGFWSSAASYVTKKLINEDINFKGADHYLPKLEKLKTGKDSFFLVIVRMTPSFATVFNTSMLVSLEDYSIEEDADDGFDVTIPITLKQYKEYGTKEVEVKTDENGNKTVTIKNNRPSKQVNSKLLKVTGEKSIWEACKKASNGALNWKDVMNLNGFFNPSATPSKGETLKVHGCFG